MTLISVHGFQCDATAILDGLGSHFVGQTLQRLLAAGTIAFGIHVDTAAAGTTMVDGVTGKLLNGIQSFAAAADEGTGVIAFENDGVGVIFFGDMEGSLDIHVGEKTAEEGGDAGGDFVIGHYTGNNALRQNISLGFQPTVVFGFAPPPYDSYSSGVQLLGFTWRCAAGANYVAQADTTPEGYTCSADELFAKNHGGAAITSDGFAVGYAEGYCQAANTNRRYLYVAFRA